MTGRTDNLAGYRQWLVETALPCWATRGFNAPRGRFRERLDLVGDPVAVPSRAMVQARQIYVFATAARQGWLPDAASLAERALDNLVRQYGDVGPIEASFAFSIDENGSIVSAVRDAYTHAFILFSLAAAYRLTGDSSLLTLADKVIRFIQERMICQAHGGLVDALPQTGGEKRQNPHMHLLEAYLFLDRAAPGRGYLDLAGGIVDLFRTKLFDSQSGCLLEYFGRDWSRHPDAARGAIWEPGHHMEWVWLLHAYARASGRPVAPESAVLFKQAIDYGVAGNGLLVDEVHNVDKSVIRASSRLWPHTEAMKAAVARGGRPMEWIARSMAGALLTHFLDKPFAGGWIDHLAPDGSPLVDYVPASSLYHLFLAGNEIERGFGGERAVAALVSAKA